MDETALRVVARIKAKAENVEQVRELLSTQVGPTRNEPGCLKYELLQNRDDPTDFTFVEEWTSVAALENHSASDHIKAVRSKLPPLVMGPTDIRMYSLVL
jgi:quinol monooxygenase YgiN